MRLEGSAVSELSSVMVWSSVPGRVRRLMTVRIPICWRVRYPFTPERLMGWPER